MNLIVSPSRYRFVVVVMLITMSRVSQGAEPVVWLNFERGLQAEKGAGQLRARSAGIDLQNGPKGMSVQMGPADELYYEFSNPRLFEEGSLTFWVSPDWPANDQRSHVLAGFADASGNTTMYIWKPSFETPQLVVTYPEMPMNQQNRIWSVINWTRGSWHHIAFTWSKSRNQLLLYSDGQRIQMDPQQRSSRYISLSTVKYLVIGERLTNGGYQHGSALEGRMVDVRLYDSCLTELQVQSVQHSAKPSPRPAPVLPQQRSAVQVAAITPAPVIDGKLDDPAWKSAARLEGFSSPRTRGWIAGDTKGLYFALAITAEEGETLVAHKRLENDPHSMVDDSLVEVHLVIEKSQRLSPNIVLNPRGVIGRLDSKGSICYDLNWTCRTDLRDKGFTAEIAIPFPTLGINERTGQEWGLNIIRRVKSTQGPDRYIRWSPVGADLQPLGLLLVPQLADSQFKKQFYQPEPLDRPLVFRDGQTDAWIESNLRRVMKEDHILPKNKSNGKAALRVEAAKNDYESCQLVIRPGRDIKKVNWKVSDLWGTKNRKISADHIALCRVGYVNNQFADVLIPGNDFPLKAGEARSLWITVYAPADAASGSYESILTLDLDGLKLTCPLNLTVWNHAIPFEQGIATPFFSFWEGTQTPYDHRFGKPADTKSLSGGIYVNPQWDQFMEGIFEMLAKHRLNHNDATPNSFYYGYVGAMKWDPTGPEVTARFRRWARFWRSHGRHVGQIMYPYNVQSEKEFENHRDNMVKFYRYWHGVLVNNNWLQYSYASALIDEPAKPDPMLKAWAKLVKENAPGLRRQIWTAGHGLDTRESANVHAWVGSIDGWGFDDRNFDQPGYCDFARQRQRQGEKIYWYIHPYCDLNASPALTRSFFWNMARCNIDGCLYFSLNYFWGNGHTKRAGDDFQIDSGTTGYQLGDGQLLWPGPDEVYGSLRLTSIRDGLEDYEAYRMLERWTDRLKTRLEEKGISASQVKIAGQLTQTARTALNLPQRMGCRSHKELPGMDQIPAARREIARCLEQFIKFGWDDSSKQRSK